MTELQYGLIGLGIATLAGVLGYNKWQEYRHRKVAEAVLTPHHDDVLLKVSTKSAPVIEPDTEAPAFAQSDAPGKPQGKRIEPGLFKAEPVFSADDNLPEPTLEPKPALPATPEVHHERPPETPAFAMPAAEPIEPPKAPPAKGEAFVLPGDLIDEPDSAPIGEVPAELLDPRLEFIVAMELIEPVPARQILHSQREMLQKMSKPVHWIAFNERKREWERLHLDSELPVRRLRVGLQLVNRLGPISGSDLVIFTDAMQALADELMAVADMPPSRVLDQAVEIDTFCAAVDLEIGLNLVSRGTPFPGTKIRALAEAAGLVLGMDGLFTRYDDDGRPQFSLQNYENAAFTADNLRSLSTHGLTFLLDVPRVDHGERVFQQMTELAKRFCDTLQGTLVDDNRQPLRESQLDHIRREFIGKPQAAMQTFGLPAGSPQALRLFS